MPSSSLFSTFSHGENRVTATLLAVLQRLDLSRLERLLGAAMGESSLQLVTFANQPSVSHVPGVPDGRIAGSFALWIETKTTTGAVNTAQLERHLEHLKGGSVFERLLVITPDVEEPLALSELGDPRIVWFTFRDLSDAIDDLMSDGGEVIAEREALLLRELQSMFEEDGLLQLPHDTAVVAARVAYDDYLEHAAYVCQANRRFRGGISYLAFYRSKQIEPYVPQILRVWEELTMTDETVADLLDGDGLDQRAARLIEELRATDSRQDQSSYKLMLLSGKDDERTLRRETPLPHESQAAWTRNQRYAYSSAILSAATTRDLG